MPDCSKFAEKVVELGMAIATKEHIESFDDMAFEMTKLIPELNRGGIADAFLEVQKANERKSTDLQKKLTSIYNEPRIEKKTKDKIKELSEFIDTGNLPEKKSAKTVSLRIEELRKTRDNFRKWLETGDSAMKEKFNEEIKILNEKFESGEIEIDSRDGELHKEIQPLKEEIKSLKSKIKDERDRELLIDQIEMLQNHLSAGTLPASKQKIKKELDANSLLRSVVYDLKKELRNSEPARKIRIEKSVADLEKKIKSGDILPKPKIEMENSKAIEDLLYKRELLRRELQDEIYNIKPKNLWSKIGMGWDAARLMMTTGEFSFSLRQGGIYALQHPFKWSEAISESFKAFGDARSLYELNKKIYNDPDAPMMLKSDLKLLHEGMSLTQTEEIIMNYWQDKLPVVRNFSRAALAFMNKVRFDSYKMAKQNLGKNGELTLEQAQVLSNYINNMTGRGNLKFGNVDLRPAALALNRGFFSPYFVSSRFQMVLGTPLYYKAGAKNTAGVRKYIAKEYARLGLGLAALVGLGLAVGADIEEDPRSADFGKMKFGNRRLDFAMGHAQVLRFLTQILTGTTKTVSGEINPIREKYVFLQDGKLFQEKVEMKYGATNAIDVMANFGRSKLSPQFGFVMNLVTGKKMTGDEVTLLNNTTQLIYPITYGDIYEVMQEDGVPTNTALSVLTFLGMGLQTYETKSKKPL